MTANATNSVALWPAGVASVFAYRHELQEPRRTMMTLGAASLAGGALGAVLLLRTSNTTFVHLLPWLLLLAAMVFTFGGVLSARLRAGERPHGLGLPTVAVVQLVIALYGGYFGGGMGIMMLAALSLMGMTDIHAMNGLKTLLGTFINGIAVVAFIVAGAVAWGPGIVMIVGGAAGGYAGATFARSLPAAAMRRVVLVVAWGMTAFFFWRTYLREGP